MLDEFDDTTWPATAKPSLQDAEHKPDPVPRLISRIYAASDAPLRVRVLQRLLDPLGTLGLAAIAAGAPFRIASAWSRSWARIIARTSPA